MQTQTRSLRAYENVGKATQSGREIEAAVLTKAASASETSSAEASTSATTVKTTSISVTDGADGATSSTAITSKAVSETSAAEASTSATINLAALRSDTSGAEASTAATTTKTASISTTDDVGADTSATTTVSKSASVTDGAEASDSATTAKAASVDASDSAEASTTETATSVGEFSASVTDGVGAASASTRQAAFGRVQADNAGGTTAPVRQTDAGRAQEDDAEASDAPTRQTDAARLVEDDAEAGTASTATFSATASDDAGASDNIDTLKTGDFPIFVTDGAGGADEARRTWPASRTRYEYAVVEDAPVVHNNHRTIEHTDNVSVGDSNQLYVLDYQGQPPLGQFAYRGATDDVGARDGALVIAKGSGIPPGPSPGAGEVIPLVSSFVGKGTNSTSYIFSGPDAIINGSEMSVGVDYLVMASCTLANMDASNEITSSEAIQAMIDME